MKTMQSIELSTLREPRQSSLPENRNTICQAIVKNEVANDFQKTNHFKGQSLIRFPENGTGGDQMK